MKRLLDKHFQGWNSTLAGRQLLNESARHEAWLRTLFQMTPFEREMEAAAHEYVAKAIREYNPPKPDDDE